jgi:hypothetical protein
VLSFGIYQEQRQEQSLSYVSIPRLRDDQTLNVIYFGGKPKLSDYKYRGRYRYSRRGICSPKSLSKTLDSKGAKFSKAFLS